MKKALYMFALAVLFACSSQSYGQSLAVYGAYQDCPFHCRTIRINADFTFEYRLDGDLFNDERYKGRWRFIGRNKIRATSPEDRSSPNVTEKLANRVGDYLITVMDSASRATIESAEISGIAEGVAFKALTSDDGIARIPKCQQFEITFLSYRGVHKALNPKADEFLVMLAPEQIAHRAIDQTWLIEGNRLYVLTEDGSIKKQFWLEKLSRAKERKIFR